jgi:hypothetical protein
MDGLEKLVKILEDTSGIIMTDVEIVNDLANCIEQKKKFKITINGFGGNLANVNVQVKTGKKTWIHASKNNSQPNNSGNL